MKLIVYGDLQATDGSELSYADPNATLQHLRVSRFYADLIRLYREHDCDGIIDLGDTTDDRSAIPMSTLDCLGGHLAEIEALKARVSIKLTGNHEQLQRNTAVDNRRLFEHAFSTVVSDREIVDIDSLKVFCCAYPRDHAELVQWLAKESSKIRARKILLGHFQVKGATLNHAKTTSGIPLEALAGFDLVLLGHIHQPQSLSERVHYVGSPFQQDWGEAGEQKRVLILDTKELSVTSVPLLNYPEYRAVSLAKFKQQVQRGYEHRFRVVLSSPEEAQEFFNHPAFGRAEAQYAYDAGAAEDKAEEAAKDWSFDGILRRYLRQLPPTGSGIDFSEEDMLAIGKDMVGVG